MKNSLYCLNCCVWIQAGFNLISVIVKHANENDRSDATLVILATLVGQAV